MATQPIGEQGGRLISVEEYLSTVYEPDCEYDEGLVVERNLGEFEHAFLQTLLATLFTNNMDTWGVFGLTEQRVPDSAAPVPGPRHMRLAHGLTARTHPYAPASDRH